MYTKRIKKNKQEDITKLWWVNIKVGSIRKEFTVREEKLKKDKKNKN